MATDAETQRMLGSLMARMDASEEWQAKADEKLDSIATSLQVMTSRNANTDATHDRRVRGVKWLFQLMGFGGIVAAYSWLQDHLRLW